MNIETVSDLSNEIADWLGVYGACKSKGYDMDGCHSEENKFCCRVGFNMMMEERIRKSVENEKILESIEK